MSEESPSPSQVSERLSALTKGPSYVLSILGLLAILTLFLPLAPILPELGRKTKAMSVIICLLIFMSVYMQKRALWEGELKKSVRGAAGRSIRSIALLVLVASLGLGFFLASDGASYIKQLLPGPFTAKFLIPPLQVGTFAGFTFSFSIMAALDYMSRLEQAGIYRRPPYLRPEVDLPDLSADLLRTNLQIPEGVSWKIIQRERTPSGGVRFIMSWIEEVEKTTSKGESVKLIQERKYMVHLDVRGKITSFREQTG